MADFINKETGVTVKQEGRTTEDLASQGFTAVEIPEKVQDTTITPEIAPEPVLGDIKPTEPQVINKGDLRTNVQSTFDKYGGTAGANEAFIQGVAKLAGRTATAEELQTGGTLSDVVQKFGVAEQLQGFGITKPEEKAGTTPAVKETAEEATPAARSAASQIQDLLAGIPAGVQTEEQRVMAEQRIAEKQQAVTDIGLEISEARTAIANQALLDEKEILALEGQGRGIPLGIIQAQQSELTDDQKLDLMISQNNYNNLLTQEAILTNDLATAQAIVQNTAEAYLENAQFQLDALVQQGTIEQNEADRMTEQATFERDLALQGYVPLTQNQSIEFKDNEIFTDPVTGKIYKKPMETSEVLSVSEAKALGVPYGTTEAEAQNMGITPSSVSSVSSGTVVDGGFQPIGETFVPQTFEDFIEKKQEEEQMSFTNPEEFRDEYEAKILQDKVEIAEQSSRDEETALSLVSPIAAAAYKNPNIIEGVTATRRFEIAEELANVGLEVGGFGRNQENKLRAEYTKQSADYVSQIASIGRVRASAQDPTAAGDLALIFNFMKVLDPTSVVRESEFANAAASGSFGERIKGAAKKVISGERLSDAVREDFLLRAETLFDEATNTNNQVKSEFTRLAEDAGVTPGNVIINFTPQTVTTSKQTSNAGVTSSGLKYTIEQ